MLINDVNLKKIIKRKAIKLNINGEIIIVKFTIVN